jgi:TRAP-type uncharacterized transport system fused permease subunit
MALVGAQIIVAVVTHTGLALNFASLIVAASKGILFIALVLVATVAIILGIGVPTTAAYVITATIGASAIIRMGVDPYAAHLFTFYFAVISNVTPPVAVAAYAGAGLANSDPLKTGFEAFFLASAGYLVPFMFVYNPALVLVGEKAGIVFACITAVLGIIALSGGIQGWFWGKIGVFQRLFLVIAGFLLIWHGPVTDIAGIALIGLAFIWTKFIRPEKQL